MSRKASHRLVPQPVELSPRRGWRAVFVACLALGPGSLLCSDTRAADPARSEPSGELRVRVLDAGTRQPVACTVRIEDAGGQVLKEGEGFRGGFRSAGTFTKSVVPGRVRLRITKGPEYLAAHRERTVRPGEVVEMEVALTRQVDLRRRGWYAGDHHAHMLHGDRLVPVDFDQVALAARAEDLQVLSLAQAWALDNPTPERLEAELGRRSMPDCQLTWNLEAPKNYYLGDAGRCLGHCWNLGMRGRTPDGADVIALLLEASAWDYESEKPSFANFESHLLIRAQGGAVFYTHPARWWTGPWGGAGGYPRRALMRISNLAVELPLDVLAGPTFDGLDVITGIGEFVADEKAFQLWGLLLNQGYRLAATASSDACFDRPGGATPGAARLYTYLDEPFSIAAAARAAAAGRTLATTGPLLLASVDGLPPGSSFPADDRGRVLRLEAWASGAETGGLDRVELYRNGELEQRFALEGGSGPWSTNLTLRPMESAWYCARAFGTDTRRQRAVTGAFFFEATPWRPPKPVPATVRARVVDADTGVSLDATLLEVAHLGSRLQVAGRGHRLESGTGVLEVPATVRLRAEAPGYRPVTLSPFFDHPALVEAITTLDAEQLLDWRTFERVRDRLAEVPLTFRLPRRE